MTRILLTAIGSMSAECVLKMLKSKGHYVVGTDIYPKQWHFETHLCDAFFQAPLATNKNKYIDFLLDVCETEGIEYLIPLTDLEIDVINCNRSAFLSKNIILCMQSECILSVVRNKYELYKFCKDDYNIPTINTCLLSSPDCNINTPCIAKPINGRSSEGIIRNASLEQLKSIMDKSQYIVQEQIDGDIYTVDYCRFANSGTDCAVPRKELLRTKNGAGLTVMTSNNQELISLTKYIGQKLDVNGCVNMEFIHSKGHYYLIDINPRFSAGVAFSLVSGYDMINAHLSCFMSKEIFPQISIQDRIIIKKYLEVCY